MHWRTALGVLSLAMLLLPAMLLACASPVGPAQADQLEVVRTYLEAQRNGRADDAIAAWGFGTDAFREKGDAAAEEAIKADIRRKADAGEPKQYRIGTASESPQNKSRVFVEVWLDRPQQGPPSLYELARTPSGWKIVAFAGAPNPLPRQP